MEIIYFLHLLMQIGEWERELRKAVRNGRHSAAGEARERVLALRAECADIRRGL